MSTMELEMAVFMSVVKQYTDGGDDGDGVTLWVVFWGSKFGRVTSLKPGNKNTPNSV